MRWRTALKWLLPAFALAELLLVYLGMLSGRNYLLLSTLLEGGFLLFACWQVFRMTRAYRRARREGHSLDLWRTIEERLGLVIPGKVARLMTIEAKLWYCLGRWLLRRRPGDDEFPYHKRTIVGMLLVLAAVEVPAELLLAEALIPWSWLRVVLLIASLYGSFWLVGFYASLRVLRHRLEPDGVRVRYGAFAEGFLPYADIASVVQEQRRAPDGRDGLRYVAGAGGHAPEIFLATGGRTDVTINLRTPHAVQGFLRQTEPVAVIHLATDAPDRLSAALRQRIEPSFSPEQVVQPSNESNEAKRRELRAVAASSG